MLRSLLERARQGRRTMAYPKGPAPQLSPRFRGRPRLDPGLCQDDCVSCLDACPTSALRPAGPAPTLDLGRCIFCVECVDACPTGALAFSANPQLAARDRRDLVVDGPEGKLRARLDGDLQRLLGRSLKLRQVSAGGCNACEADVNVLSTVGWDVGRFGIDLVASPRHADGILVTGPVTNNMEVALEKTYAAIASPKIVIAVGACAISGGLFAEHPETRGGADRVVPVDLYVPGCPPHPLTLLDGLLRLVGRLADEA